MKLSWYKRFPLEYNHPSEVWDCWVGTQTPSEFCELSPDGGTLEEFQRYVDSVDEQDELSEWTREELKELAQRLHEYAHTHTRLREAKEPEEAQEAELAEDCIDCKVEKLITNSRGEDPIVLAAVLMKASLAVCRVLGIDERELFEVTRRAWDEEDGELPS